STGLRHPFGPVFFNALRGKIAQAASLTGRAGLGDLSALAASAGFAGLFPKKGPQVSELRDAWSPILVSGTGTGIFGTKAPIGGSSSSDLLGGFSGIGLNDPRASSSSGFLGGMRGTGEISIDPPNWGPSQRVPGSGNWLGRSGWASEDE